MAPRGSKKDVVAADAQSSGERGDLFTWIDSLFTKVRLDGTPPTYVMHRFLASDPTYASIARWLGQYVRDPRLVVGCWQAILPVQRAAPRLQYVAAKKAPAAEALVVRMMAALAERRDTVERMIAITTAAGQLSALYAEFGIEPPAP